MRPFVSARGLWTLVGGHFIRVLVSTLLYIMTVSHGGIMAIFSTCRPLEHDTNGES